MSNFKDKISKIVSKEVSPGVEKSKLRTSRPWLNYYSSQIARRILAVIEDKLNYSQVKLAEDLNVSPQQISKIVKGHENLTLETIYKLSIALEFDLISFPEYKYSAKPINYAEMKQLHYDRTYKKETLREAKKIEEPQRPIHFYGNLKVA